MKTQKTGTERNDAQFVEDVIAHYTNQGRHGLIWRKNITAYKILVSEIMLQQTQVSRVEPKFKAWMASYPTLASLGEAPFLDILKLWQGLGYQRRAKALYEIGKTVTALPKTYEGLLALKGIGPYTASALLAFAYNIFPEYLLETNIRTALIEGFHQGEVKVHDGVLYDDLARLTDNKRVQSMGARIWYYALMDYGAHLKAQKISHNAKSAHYSRQSPYAGSLRQLRAQILFAITHKEALPDDERRDDVLGKLVREGYIVRKGKGYVIAQ